VHGWIAVNGAGVDEPYVVVNALLTESPGTCAARRFETIKVPAGEVFVLGDQRRVSVDSRCLGSIPGSAVVAVLGPAPTGQPTVS
jgi:type IV secretory pathway protease TraF